MSRYRIHATVIKTYVTEEEVTLEVKADDHEHAERIAYSDAEYLAKKSRWDADHDETDVTVDQVELLEPTGDEVIMIPRCTRTIDMFAGAS